MKFLPLIWAGIWRRPVRAALTMVSVVSAFVLFGVLQGFSAGLNRLIADAHADLLLTQSQVSNIDPLPVSLAGDIAHIPGVRVVAKMVFFGGAFRRPDEGLRALAVDPDEVRQLDDQLKVTADQWAAMKRVRAGALVPSDVAQLYGIKVGDRIALHPNFVANRNGTHTWPVDVVGIYPGNRDDSLSGNVFANYDYADNGRGGDEGTVHIFNTRIDDPRKSGEIAAAIDRLTANSPHATRTFSDRQLAQASVTGIGQVGLAVKFIAGAVFFALLFSVGAVMIQSGRERAGEFAVLKTLGYSDWGVLTLILAETLIFCLAAAALGLALSRLLYPIVVKFVGFNGFASGPVAGVGLLVAALLAIVAGAIPAWRASRLSIVDALAGR